MTKFDLFLFSKKNTKKSTQVKSNKFEQSDNENNLTDNKKVENDSQHSIIKRGLEFLDKMFPQAGWLNLENHPDMYPYFQPIYSFKDGFNLLSPKNPMQITVVLLRIIEDFFQACRNIRFSIDKEPDFSNLNDNLYDVFSEWYLYREDIYEKNYSSELKDYVNHLDTQSDFIHSPYAKKKLCTLQWQAKYSFLPNLSFELVYMEKPTKETNYKPLHKRTDYLIKVFSTLISRIDDYLVSPVNSIKEMPDFGAANIMGQYRFDVPNSISRRLNYFLGGKKSRHTINLNLLKYALCVISVLHWWISDENSPAYAYPNSEPFRKTEEGKPIFSVPIIEDANDLFIKKPTE
ncbi:MAG: hypothetical protein GX220_01875, partial [Treponema sp.]|nr:hypothetical protein [Treponema sp.]